MEIKLNNSDSVAIVDDDFFYKYKTWWISGSGYPICDFHILNKPRRAWLHHLVIGKKDGFVVDHINGDVLDNRRDNLRFCTHKENIRKMIKRKSKRKSNSIYKGVCNHKKREDRWRSYIKVDGKQISLGVYGDEISAAKAYNEAAKKHFGEFCSLNKV